MKVIKAWYFSDETKKLRYGDSREITIGVEHTVTGYPRPCNHGLHGSVRLIDALQYAPSPIVWQVELSGRIKKADDKLAATRRKYIAGGIDISDTLRLFSRKQALSVVDKWNCPDIVRQWLETGDESIRSAAESAARSAARSAAESAAEYAAWSAAWSAAEYAAEYAARSAAWSAANDMLEAMVFEAIK
jgi:hypothetical protein